MTETYILIQIKQSKPIQDLTDKAAGRIYTMDGVEDVTATLLSPEQVKQLQEKEQ
jgi:hypothetical protein